MQKKRIRTSENDPLRIAELPLGKGLMGLTLCPGKKDEDAMYAPCWRDLEADLQVVKDWGAGIVVTLMEKHELKFLQVVNRGDGLPDFGEAVQSLGMKWWHLPVKDQYPLEDGWKGRNLHGGHRGERLMMTIVAYETVNPWNLDCALLRHFLHGGGRVLIHCRGGLGRTGTLAARLLMEEGMDAESAMCAVRKVRPGAIETEIQEEYLREFRGNYWKLMEMQRRRQGRHPVRKLDSTKECPRYLSYLLAQVPPDRVAQLVRLFLEIPWAFTSGWPKNIRGRALEKIMKACIAEGCMADAAADALDTEVELMRDMLGALYYCHDKDSANVIRAREYFGVSLLPEPDMAAAVVRERKQNARRWKWRCYYSGESSPEPEPPTLVERLKKFKESRSRLLKVMRLKSPR